MTNTTSERPDGDKTGEIDLQILEMEYERARERLNQQQETLKEFSREGLQVFRLLLLFVAAPTALFGAIDPNTLFQANDAVLSNECGISGLESCLLQMKHISFLTGISLVMCAGMNLFASGYEARGIHNASNPKDIHKTISNRIQIEDYWEKRLKAYRDRIEHNDRVISFEESLLVLGKVTFLLSVFGITSIIVVFMIESPLGVSRWFTVLLLFLSPVVYSFFRTPKEYQDADRFFRYTPLYENQFEAQITDNVGREEEPENVDKEVAEKNE